MDVASWLRSLGLEQYEATFRDNVIDDSVLPDLTDQDLEKLGVLLGHRRKLLRAIANLEAATKTSEGAAVTSAEVDNSPRDAAERRHLTRSTAAVSISAAVEVAGERRYLTVMFCDLVGSTSISAQLDAEEWRDLVGVYLDAASAAVTEMGGRAGKNLGARLIAPVGYPVAQENDTERAARAALAIQRALAELNRKNAGSSQPELTARIGLETGPAVIDAAGEI